MPLFVKIFLGLEIFVFAFFVVALIVKLIQRIREYKKDKYKNIKY